MAEKCPCKGDYLDKLLQPAILAVLSEGPAYGLELLRELERRHLATGRRRYGLLPRAEKAGIRGQAQLGLARGARRAAAACVFHHAPPAPAACKTGSAHLRAYLRDVRRISAAVDRACEACGMDKEAGNAETAHRRFLELLGWQGAELRRSSRSG